MGEGTDSNQIEESKYTELILVLPQLYQIISDIGKRANELDNKLSLLENMFHIWKYGCCSLLRNHDQQRMTSGLWHIKRYN